MDEIIQFAEVAQLLRFPLKRRLLLPCMVGSMRDRSWANKDKEFRASGYLKILQAR